MYIHVWTMYIQSSDNAIVCTMLRHVCTYHEMYIHVCTWYIHLWTIINMDVHSTYMVCTFRSINMYVHCSDVYVHVYTFTYTFWIIETCTYNVQTYISQVCAANIWCTDGYIHFMNCTDVVELRTYTDISFRVQLFYSPGQLARACRLGLAAAWCHTYSSSSTLV